jgi:fructose-1,6-bisphosphatase/inositol monophosphatase family enzyme
MSAGQPASPTDQLAAWEVTAAGHLSRVAREIVRPSCGANGEGDHRWISPTQVHTAADDEAGAALHELFTGSFPGHGLVIEDRPAVVGDGEWQWFLDPIDGSANHLRGIPYVSLSAGLCRGGQPVLGVVHDLHGDRTLAAHAGGGAHCRSADGRRARLRVAGTSALSDAMLIAHLSRRGPLIGLPDALPRLLWNVRKIRCMGSIALDLALLAGGEADLLVVGRGTPQRMLDIVGGLVLLQEAGGAVMTARGDPVSAATRTLVAGPPALCRAFVELMADVDLEGWEQARARPPSG